MRMRKNIFINLFVILILFLIFLFLIPSSISDAPPKDWIIEGNKVYINDSKVYISAEPHTLQERGYVYFNITSKVYTGDIDVVWGFDTDYLKPTRAELYKPEWKNNTESYTCQTDFFNYTLNPKYAWCYENITIYDNQSNINESYLQLIFENSFEWGNLTEKTIYWNINYLKEWKDYTSNFDFIDYNYSEMNKWYYIKNVPIIANQSYLVRGYIEVLPKFGSYGGKYWFVIKPSFETIQQAIQNNHFYALDPWWNSSWYYKKQINISENTGNTWANYSVYINVTYDTDMQADFDDLRFVNNSETGELKYFVQTKTDSNSAQVWVKTSLTGNTNTSIYMYYGNSGVSTTSNGTDAFVFYDDGTADRSSEYNCSSGVDKANLTWASNEYTIGWISPGVIGKATCMVKSSYNSSYGNLSMELSKRTPSINGEYVIPMLRARNNGSAGYYPQDWAGSNYWRIIRITNWGETIIQRNEVASTLAGKKYNYTFTAFNNTINSTRLNESAFRLQLNTTNTTTTYSSGAFGIAFYQDTNNRYHYFYNLRVREYGIPEPSYIFGAEETPPDTIYPNFSNYWDNNATLVGSGTGLFNVTITSTNGTVLLEINNTNVTAGNLSASVYNASYTFTTNGTYTYRWHSWGNGTDKNYNKSIDRSYTVNASIQTYSRNITQSFTSTSSINRIGSLKRNTLQNFINSFLISRLGNFKRASFQSFTNLFSINRLYSGTRNIFQSFSPSFLVSRVYNGVRNIPQSFILDFSINRLRTVSRNILQSFVGFFSLLTEFIPFLIVEYHGAGGMGANPEVIGKSLGIEYLSFKVCNLTYFYILKNGVYYGGIFDLIKNNNLTEKWTTIRVYIDNWQGICSDLSKRTLKPQLVCEKIFLFLSNKSYSYSKQDILDLQKEISPDLIISTYLLEYYIENNLELCYSRGYSEKLEKEPVLIQPDDYSWIGYIIILLMIGFFIVFIVLKNQKKIVMLLIGRKKLSL